MGADTAIVAILSIAATSTRRNWNTSKIIFAKTRCRLVVAIISAGLKFRSSASACSKLGI
jgi:hypothetical protein